MTTTTQTQTLAEEIGIPTSHLDAFMQYAVSTIRESGEQPTEASLTAAIESYSRITARAADMALKGGEQWDVVVSAIGPSAYDRIHADHVAECKCEPGRSGIKTGEM